MVEGPSLVVASRRDTISTASSIKRLASDKVFVQIQHPRLRLNRFDMVITPKHDYYPLTPQGPKQVPRFLRSRITPCDPPDSHVVLTMGAIHQIDFTSIRSAAISWHDEFEHIPRPLLVVNIGGPTQSNMHIGNLAWADAFVLTADSVSMISEACSTGKPVYVVGAERCRCKLTEFHKSLRDLGVVRSFSGSEDVS